MANVPAAPHVRLRHAGAGDGADLGRLRFSWRKERNPDEPHDEGEFVDAFRRWWERHLHSHPAVVAVDGETLVGMAFLAVVDRPPNPGALQRCHGDLQSMYIRPEHRGRGTGPRMVAAVLDLARELGCDKVTVHSGHRALPLYQRAGFVAIDRWLTLDLTELSGPTQPR